MIIFSRNISCYVRKEVVWPLFFVCFLASLLADIPPAQTFCVGNGSVIIPGGVIAMKYCAFLNTEATNDWVSPYLAAYFDSSYMTEKTSGYDIDVCIIRTGKEHGRKWFYSVVPGREDYTIIALNSQRLLDKFNEWLKNPSAEELRNYINNKIAETVSHNSDYADSAYKIRGTYCQSSYSFDKLDNLVKALLGNRFVNISIPFSFDDKGRAMSCLFDQKVGQGLLYFDHTVGAEGEEAAADFANFPTEMKICAHLYPGSACYGPNEIYQTMISPDPVPVLAEPISTDQPTDAGTK